MIKEAIQYICDRAVEASGPKTLELRDGRILSKDFDPVNTPGHIVPLRFKTLKGLIDYVANVDEIDLNDQVLVVGGPGQVDLQSDILMPWNIRQTFAVSEFDAIKFPFGRYVEHEVFLIGIQSMFVDNEDRKKVLDMVGHIEQAEVHTHTDDGAGQSVALKRSTKAGNFEIVPNPVNLAPFRTFPEVEQPVSSFVFRLKRAEGGEGPKCMLIEADGGAWRIEAIQRVKAWLTAKLTELGIDIPVLG